MKFLEYRMKQGLLKDILTWYKTQYQNDFITMAHSDLRGYMDDVDCMYQHPKKEEIDFISRPFLKTFIGTHDIILQMSWWIASMSYESALECYCKLCLCD